MSDPYISVVIVGRNDNYGVNFLSRINTFVRSLDHQVRNYPDLIELVVVEWNPLDDRPGLKDVLAPVSNLDVRIITVPPEVHNSIGHTVPVLEYYGKNVGIRRARGKFVLITNPDIIFTQELVDEFGKQQLDPSCFYRTDRYDFVSDGIDSIEPENYIKFACEHVFDAHLTFDDFTASQRMAPPVSLENLPVSSCSSHTVHTNACGDFILASRESFFKIHGVLESTTEIYHVDSISLYKLFDYSCTQKIFASPMCMFHQHHDRRYNSLPRWDLVHARQLGSVPNPSWGLGDTALPEHEL